MGTLGEGLDGLEWMLVSCSGVAEGSDTRVAAVSCLPLGFVWGCFVCCLFCWLGSGVLGIGLSLA